MGESPSERTEQDPKLQRKPFFELADNELMITHASEPRIHRIVFSAKNGVGNIPTKSSLFFKLKAKFQTWIEQNAWNYYKNSSYTFGLNSNGKIQIYVKSDLSVFPKEFLRSLKQDFNLQDIEIKVLLDHLDCVDLEIAHKINDPLDNLKKAKVKYDFDSLIQKLIAFTDNSHGNIEIELRGDPKTSGNLEFLLRDKLNAILYFAELTKILVKLTEIQNQQNEITEFIKNGMVFLIDDLLNKRLNKEVK